MTPEEYYFFKKSWRKTVNLKKLVLVWAIVLLFISATLFGFVKFIGWAL